MKNTEEYLDFAREIAWEAGQLTLGYFQAGVRPEWKGDDTPVTIADRSAETLIRKRIQARYPQHAIIGEEFGADDSDAEFRWYIDPIDGTKSFIRGVPLYGVLVGLEVAGRVEVGVAHFPALNEMVSAGSGLGCWWNGRRCKVSAETNLSRAVLTHIDGRNFSKFGRGEAWQRLQNATYYNVGWSDAYGYALVATGRAEIAIDPIMSDWDCGPLPVILREAGGYFGDWQGNETIHAKEALATNAALRDTVLALINE